jgi:hypothetical protein
MSALSVWYVRTAMVYLIIGFTLGLLLLINKGIAVHPALWRLLPAHVEFLLLGWTLQLAFGVAFWILPRFQTQRGNVRLAWLAYLLLNGGIWITVAGYWFGARGGIIWAGRTLEACAAVAFALHAWPRVKPPGA